MPESKPATTPAASKEPELPRLTLSNVGHGAAIELYDQELRKVLENILDPNTEPESIRSITLRIKFAPTKDRVEVAVGVEADSKLAPFKGAGSLAFVGRKNGEVIAVTHDPRQMQMNWDAEGKPRPLHPV